MRCGCRIVDQVSTLSSMHPSRRSTLTSQQLALGARRKSIIGVKRDGKEFWEARTTYRRGVTPDNLRPYAVRPVVTTPFSLSISLLCRIAALQLWCLSVCPSVPYGGVSIQRQRHCSVVHGLTPVLRGICSVLSSTTTGAKSRGVGQRTYRSDTLVSTELMGCMERR